MFKFEASLWNLGAYDVLHHYLGFLISTCRQCEDSFQLRDCVVGSSLQSESFSQSYCPTYVRFPACASSGHGEVMEVQFHGYLTMKFSKMLVWVLHVEIGFMVT